ncbi:hypothetical protein Pelo_5173 [Pelomyxa schiedti]|nr:hypothetical protein Pelo_5173 [Pelomyxa schiedti]
MSTQHKSSVFLINSIAELQVLFLRQIGYYDFVYASCLNHSVRTPLHTNVLFTMPDLTMPDVHCIAFLLDLQTTQGITYRIQLSLIYMYHRAVSSAIRVKCLPKSLKLTCRQETQ